MNLNTYGPDPEVQPKPILPSYNVNPAHGLAFPFLDITAPEHGVEIQIRADKQVIWIHVDGQTVLRVCMIPQLVVNDDSKV